MTMMLHNYRSRQFHRTSNGTDPSRGFRDMGSTKSGPSAASFDKFLAHGQAHMGQITMTVHNYRSRQVHETLNGVNPSNGFRDMHSAKSGPNLCQIWQVFGPWARPYGANGQMTMTVHNYRPRQFHRTSNGENPSRGYRDMGSASLAAARPPARPDRDDNTPPALWTFKDDCKNFTNITMKSWSYQSIRLTGYTTLSIHILFVPCQSALPFLG